LCWGNDVIMPGLCASTTEVVSITCIDFVCVAAVVVVPLAHAINWASWLLTFCCVRFSIRRTVLAFFTTILGGRDLDPHAVLVNWFVTVQAAGTVSILGPVTTCIDGAWFWFWICAGSNFHLVTLGANLTTILGFLGDDPMTGLGAIIATAVSALVPL